MANFKLINVDTTNRHVTVSYSDNVAQTMGDCPLDSVENRDKFLAEYGDRYEQALAEAPKIAPDITQGVGQTITPELPINPAI